MNRPTSTPQSGNGLWRMIVTFWPYLRQQWRLLMISGIALLADLTFPSF